MSITVRPSVAYRVVAVEAILSVLSYPERDLSGVQKILFVETDGPVLIDVCFPNDFACNRKRLLGF